MFRAVGGENFRRNFCQIGRGDKGEFNIAFRSELRLGRKVCESKFTQLGSLGLLGLLSRGFGL